MFRKLKLKPAMRIIIIFGIAIQCLFLIYQLVWGNLVSDIALLKHVITFSVCFVILPFIARLIRNKYKKEVLTKIYAGGFWVVFIIYGIIDGIHRQIWEGVETDYFILIALPYIVFIIAYPVSLSVTILGEKD